MNFSDRFLGIVAGTKPPGNDPHAVATAIRGNGLISDEFLPFSDSIKTADEYYSFKDADERLCRKMGQDFLKNYDFQHEWLFSLDIKVTNRRDTMMEALQMSPLGVSVTAWIERDGIYYDDGKANNHWCVCFGYVEDEYWKIFDSYDQTIKKLAWDFNFQCAKKYRVVKRPVATSWWSGIINLIKSWMKK